MRDDLKKAARTRAVRASTGRRRRGPAPLRRGAGLDRRGRRGAAGGRAARPDRRRPRRRHQARLGRAARAAPTSSLDTTRITGVVEHAAGDLVVTVRAGHAGRASCRPWWPAAGQQLALDTPLPGATVGGTLAVGTSGPRRLLYGTARDLLIGITFVRADGVVAKAGGKVVKNVAGYDFGKLLTGSFGTLGVITEAVFRLHPLPAARRAVTAICLDAAAAGARGPGGPRLAGRARRAVEVDAPATATVAVTVLVEGVEAGVAGRTAVVAGPARRRRDRAGRATARGSGHLPFDADGTGLKLTASLPGVGTGARAPPSGIAHAPGRRAQRPRLGGRRPATPGCPRRPTRPTVAAVVADLRAAASPYDGTVTVLTAPGEVRDQVDLWGPVPGLDADAPPQGRARPGAPAVARPIRRRHLDDTPRRAV